MVKIIICINYTIFVNKIKAITKLFKINIIIFNSL